MPEMNNHQPLMKYIKNSLLLSGAIFTSGLSLLTADVTEPKSYNLLTEEGLGNFVKDGKVILDARLRYEFTGQDNLPVDTTADSSAVTLRSRVGFQTAVIGGFQGLVEAENVTLLSDDEYVNLAGTTPGGGNNPGGRAIQADPEDTEVNRLWGAYTIEKNTFKIGRERMVLDDARFIGNVGWRQNEQTYDMFQFKSTYVDNFTFTYAYMWEVNRIFGQAAAGATTKDFEGDMHVANASYKFGPFLTVSGFAYLLDMQRSHPNFIAADPASRDIYGIRASGVFKLNEDGKLKISYEGSYANQSDNDRTNLGGNSDVDLGYYTAQAKLHFGPTYFGGGIEVLEGNGTNRSFATPLATVHAFQGFADVFLGESIAGNSGNGVVDYHITAGTKIPVGKGLILKAWYHWFESDSATATFDGDFGTEFDAVAVYPINKYFKVLSKFASYSGEVNAPAGKNIDKTVYTLELNFTY